MIAPLAALLRLHDMRTQSSAPISSAEEPRLLQALSPDIQKRYLRVTRRHGASAVVALERRICTGCHMRQPNHANEIEEDIYECQNCGRLLFDPDVAYDFSA